MKTCPRCTLEKDEAEFYQHPSGKRHSWCSECRRGDSRRWYLANREYALARDKAKRASLPPEVRRERNRRHGLQYKYGITQDDFDRLLRDQAGACAICGRGIGTQPLCVDHDHDTGEVRGILCRDCNSALGLFKDDPWRVWRAANYLTPSRLRGVA